MAVSDIVKEFYEKGKKVEGDFANDLLLSKGGTVTSSTVLEDINSHIDLFWDAENGKKKCSFDVKGARKKDRSDEYASWDSTWLELKNVHGNDGSLLGKEDYIVFEAEREWLITNRKKLLESVLAKTIDPVLYTENPHTFYKRYQRSKWGRKDEIILVPMSFIEEHTVQRIPKNVILD